MRSALRFVPPLAGGGTFAAALLASLACGPSELFIGAFAEGGIVDSTIDGEPEGRPVDDASGTCDEQLDGRDASSLPSFTEPACLACALDSCCAEVSRCFPSDVDANAAPCAVYAQCVQRCRTLDASVGSSDDAGVPPVSCIDACNELGRPALYSELEACLVMASCECPPL